MLINYQSIEQHCKIIDNEGELSDNIEYILKKISPTKVIIISDSVVHSHYSELLDRCIPKKFSVEWIVLNPGETSKLITEVLPLIEKILRLGIDRTSLIIGFGGGVITDITGFVASIILRGISWIAIPTTVIGMTDAAIGGKTGVNTMSGKNLVGTFYPPEHILTFPKFLNTLSKRDINAGWGEIIKYGLLEGGALWEKVCNHNLTTIPSREIIELCIRYKERVVEEDPFDEGLRMQLNLGHTAGHALEVATGYEIFKHGEAVLWGLGVTLELSRLHCRLPEESTELAQNLISRISLPTSDVDPDLLISHLKLDKKRVNNNNIWVLLKSLGKIEFMDNIPDNIVYEVITKHLELLKN